MHHGRSPRAAERVNRLQQAASMLRCARTQARYAAAVAALFPVNYRAGTGARCKQQERNRLPVKGEIYRRAFVTFLNGLTKSESRRPPNRHITGATTGVFS